MCLEDSFEGFFTECFKDSIAGSSPTGVEFRVKDS